MSAGERVGKGYGEIGRIKGVEEEKEKGRGGMLERQ